MTSSAVKRHTSLITENFKYNIDAHLVKLCKSQKSRLHETEVDSIPSSLSRPEIALKLKLTFNILTYWYLFSKSHLTINARNCPRIITLSVLFFNF